MAKEFTEKKVHANNLSITDYNPLLQLKKLSGFLLYMVPYLVYKDTIS